MAARKARAALADLRALEEQSERANPIAPSTKRKAVTGAGATPSMGLSQFRGGRTRKMPSLKVEELKESPSLHNAMEDEMALMPSGEYDGAGKGSLLGHLKGLGEYLHAMEGGIKSGKYEGEGKKARRISIHAAPAASHAGNTAKARNWVNHRHMLVREGSITLEAALHAAAHALQLNAAEKAWATQELRRRGTDPDTESDEEAEEVTGRGATPSSGLSQFRGGMAMGQVVGSGKAALSDSESDSESEEEEMEGSAKAAAPKAAKKKRAPAGPDDGRRKRAAIVKKVMADKGMSMIEASKYVKEHGLY